MADLDSGETTLVSRDGQNLVATWKNLVLAVWGEAPGPISMRAIHKAHLDLLKRHPKVAHLALITGAPRIPTAEARDVATEYNKQSRMSSIAVVVDGDGFWLSAARGFLTAVLFLQRSSAPTQVFKELDEALLWQSSVLGDAAPANREARAALLALRATLER